MKRLAAGLILLLTPACAGESTSPSDPLRLSFSTAPVHDTAVVIARDTVRFTGYPYDPKWQQARPILARTGVGAIEITGYYVSGCWRPPAHQLRRTGSTLTLLLWTDHSGVCLTSIGAYSYVARFSDVAPGRYRLRVEHRDDLARPGWPEIQDPYIAIDREIAVQ